MAPIGELLTESETARGKRQKQYQEQQQSAQPQPQSQPQDSKAAAQQSQRPGHNRKRTWSAPAGTVEHLMSTAAAAAAVGGPAMTTKATAHNTPNKTKKAGDGEAAASSGARGEYSRQYEYHGDLLSDSFGRSESYDYFDDDMRLGGGGGNRDISSNAPATPVVVEEADRGGGHGHAHHSQGESSFPDILPSGAIDLGGGLGVGGDAAAASTPPRHYRRPRTLSDVGSLASRASPSMHRILHGLGYRLSRGYIRSFLATFVSWMERNPVGGFFVFIIFFILTTREFLRDIHLCSLCCLSLPYQILTHTTTPFYVFFVTVVFIPPSILTLGSGVAFSKAFGLGPGVVLAASSSFVGACIGAVIAFFRARYLMRDLIKLFARRYPVVKATDRAIKHKGFRIYLLLRMCPVIPFNALNYIGGITGVKWQAYTFALIGILPWQIVLVFIGATVGSVNNMDEDDQNSYNTVSVAIGCVFSVISLLFMWYYARKELKREIAAHQEVEPGEEGRGDDVESQSNDSSASLPNGSASNDLTGVSRVSLASLQGFSEFETESTADDGSVEGGEDEKWYWIWT